MTYGEGRVDRVWSGLCRDCGHQIQAQAATDSTVRGIWVRCAGCRTINWVTDYTAPSRAGVVNDA